MAKKLINTEVKVGEGVLSRESTTVSPRNGFNVSEVTVEKIADLVIISGILFGDIPQNSYTLVGVVPDGFRPKIDIRTGAATVGGNVGVAEITPDGSLLMNQRTGRNDMTWMSFNLTYITQ